MPSSAYMAGAGPGMAMGTGLMALGDTYNQNYEEEQKKKIAGVAALHNMYSKMADGIDNPEAKTMVWGKWLTDVATKLNIAPQDINEAKGMMTKFSQMSSQEKKAFTAANDEIIKMMGTPGKENEARQLFLKAYGQFPSYRSVLDKTGTQMGSILQERKGEEAIKRTNQEKLQTGLVSGDFVKVPSRNENFDTSVDHGGLVPLPENTVENYLGTGQNVRGYTPEEKTARKITEAEGVEKAKMRIREGEKPSEKDKFNAQKSYDLEVYKDNKKKQAEKLKIVPKVTQGFVKRVLKEQYPDVFFDKTTERWGIKEIVKDIDGNEKERFRPLDTRRYDDLADNFHLTLAAETKKNPNKSVKEITVDMYKEFKRLIESPNKSKTGLNATTDNGETTTKKPKPSIEKKKPISKIAPAATDTEFEKAKVKASGRAGLLGGNGEPSQQVIVEEGSGLLNKTRTGAELQKILDILKRNELEKKAKESKKRAVRGGILG